MELRSRVGGRYLLEQLRVRLQRRQRVTPSRFFLLVITGAHAIWELGHWNLSFL